MIKKIKPFQCLSKCYLGGRWNQESVVLLNSLEADADNRKSLARLLVVNKQWDIVFKELHGLLPTQETDFIIELDPRTAPIYITPF